ncbi:unnamed protein product [Victoria cruziana]
MVSSRLDRFGSPSDLKQ